MSEATQSRLPQQQFLSCQPSPSPVAIGPKSYFCPFLPIKASALSYSSTSNSCISPIITGKNGTKISSRLNSRALVEFYSDIFHWTKFSIVLENSFIPHTLKSYHFASPYRNPYLSLVLMTYCTTGVSNAPA